MSLLARPVRALLAICGSAALGTAFLIAGAGTAGAATHSALRVGCGHHSYSTIGAAVGAASAGDTILVCPGTYPGGVVLSIPVSLIGVGHPIINAAGANNGVQVLASGSKVQGFTVKNALGEGILVGSETPGAVGQLSKVTISYNVVTHNDQGNPTGGPITTSPYPECNADPATPNVPGDCGEGIHLVKTFDSAVVANRVAVNSGGILLSDDTGATHGNLIAFNDVTDNALDCGITLAGHTPEVFGGGIYDNRILANIATDNGVVGQGAGVLLATGVPGNVPGIPGTGGAVFDNLVSGNYIAGNGLAGVTLHSHSPGENLSGNTITRNLIGKNNWNPDEDFGPHFFNPATTGVSVTSVSPITITIEHNVIFDDVNGIWIGNVTPGAVSASTASNLFIHVTNPVVTVS